MRQQQYEAALLKIVTILGVAEERALRQIATSDRNSILRGAFREAKATAEDALKEPPRK